MQKLIGELGVDLVRALDSLTLLQSRFNERVLAEIDYPTWLQDPQLDDTREEVVSFISDWEYRDGDKPGKTTQMIGLVGCSNETLNALSAFNLSKKHLQKVLMKIDKLEVDPQDFEELSDHSISRSLSKTALARLGYARFNRRQACRQLVEVKHDRRILSASFFLNQYTKTVKATAKKLKAFLQQLAELDGAKADLAAADLKKLATLSDDEVLVRVYPTSIHRRVSLNYLSPESDAIRLDQHMAHSPIFYPAKPGQPLPDVRPLPIEPIPRL